MIKALVFDCFGVLIVDTPQALLSGQVKDQLLLDYILQLRAHYKIGLLSNISSDGLASRFAKQELARYFDAIAISGEIGYAKPEAEAYSAIAERLGVRLDECIMIDDREDFCQAAHAMGMQTVHYRSRVQCQQELEAYLHSK